MYLIIDLTDGSAHTSKTMTDGMIDEFYEETIAIVDLDTNSEVIDISESGKVKLGPIKEWVD